MRDVDECKGIVRGYGGTSGVWRDTEGCGALYHWTAADTAAEPMGECPSPAASPVASNQGCPLDFLWNKVFLLLFPFLF